MNQERIVYPNPPIAEALCQLQFAEPVNWNPAVPGLVFGLIRDEYPREPEAQNQIGAGFEMSPDPNVGANFQIAARGQRMIYRDADGSRLLVLNQESLSANSLKPYEGWPSLSARLRQAVSAVSETLGVSLIRGVSLRYINRVLLPEDLGSEGVIQTDDYFTIPIRPPGEGRATLTNFIHRTESALADDDAVTIASTFATAMPEPDEGVRAPVFVLDLEFRRAFAEPATFEVALDAAERLKELENLEFEACITDRTRELFQ